MERPTHALMFPPEPATGRYIPLSKPTSEEVIPWKTIAVKPSIS